jgi:hypothetical protein
MLKNKYSLYELLYKLIPTRKKHKKNKDKNAAVSPSSNPRKAEYMKASGRY